MEANRRHLKRMPWCMVALVLMMFMQTGGTALGKALSNASPADTSQTIGVGLGEEGVEGELPPNEGELACVAVSGVTEPDIKFVLVPASIPGPGDTGYDQGTFIGSIMGYGFNDTPESDIITRFWGTEADVEAGLAVYKETAGNAMDTFSILLEHTLIPGTGVATANCPDPETVQPQPEIICVALSGVVPEDASYLIIAGDVAGPDETGFDPEAFFHGILAGGRVLEGESTTHFFGTREQLESGNLKVYAYAFDPNNMPPTFGVGDIISKMTFERLYAIVYKTECVVSPISETPAGSEQLAPADICVELSNIPLDEFYYLVVPGDVPGPDEAGFDADAFVEAVVCGGTAREGTSVAHYSGTRDQLVSGNLKVYRYAFDPNNMPPTFGAGDIISHMEISLLPGATLHETQCPGPAIVNRPRDAEVSDGARQDPDEALPETGSFEPATKPDTADA